MPFWQMTVFENKNFVGTPIDIKNIKIDIPNLSANFIRFSLKEFSNEVPSNASSILLETEQHFFGGTYKICVENYPYSEESLNAITGTLQVDIDHKSVTPYFGNTTECVDDFYVANGNHIVSIKFVTDEAQREEDLQFNIYFDYISQ